MSTVTGLSYNNCPCLYIKATIDLMNPEEKGLYSTVNAGVFDFLVSTQNKGSFKQLKSTGKVANILEKGAVYVEYYSQDCTPTVTPALNYCTLPTSANTHSGKKTAKHFADIRVTWSFTINNESTRDKCYGPEEMKRDLILANKYAVLQEIETKVQKAIEDYISGYKNQISPITSCTNPLVLNVINPTTGMLNPSVFGQMKQQFSKKKVNKPIHYFADEASLLTLTMNAMPHAVANTNGGFDVSKINPNFHVADNLSDNLSTCLAGDKILAVPQGQYQVINWNAFVDEYEVPFGQRGFFEKTTMDLWGMKWDVFMSRDTCNDVFVFESNFGVIQTAPDDLACLDQNALMFIAGCGDVDCASLQDCVEA